MGAGLELAGRHRDGTEFAVEVSLAPVEVGGTHYTAAFVRDGRERQRSLDRLRAVNEVTQSLLAGTGSGEALGLVARRARHLSHSDACWVVTPAGLGELVVSAVDGPGAKLLLGARLSAETSRSAEVMRSGAPEVIEDLSTATNVPDAVVGLELGPGLYVPLVADEHRLGALVLGRLRGGAQFGPLDIALAMVFASAAAVELGEARAELERVGILAEDERIAADLHDTVIQDLFAVGLSLQVARSLANERAGERIEEAVDALDRVIREIRNTIFRLPGRSAGARGLRDEMLRLADKCCAWPTSTARSSGSRPGSGSMGPWTSSCPTLLALSSSRSWPRPSPTQRGTRGLPRPRRWWWSRRAGSRSRSWTTVPGPPMARPPGRGSGTCRPGRTTSAAPVPCLGGNLRAR